MEQKSLDLNNALMMLQLVISFTSWTLDRYEGAIDVQGTTGAGSIPLLPIKMGDCFLHWCFRSLFYVRPAFRSGLLHEEKSVSGGLDLWIAGMAS